MTEHLEINGKKLIKASLAAERIGYSPDYVTRLARNEKIEAHQNGRAWYVDLESLKLFSLEVEAEKRERSEQLREERIRERSSLVREAREVSLQDQIGATQNNALLQTVVIAASFFVFFNFVWFAFESRVNVSNLAEGLAAIGSEFYGDVIRPVPEFFSQVASFAFIEHKRENVEDQQSVAVDGNTYSESSDSGFEGIVIFEDSEVAERDLEEVRNSFSDEVQVEFDSDDTGVVTPVFRERTGDSYRFLLVPVKPPGN